MRVSVREEASLELLAAGQLDGQPLLPARFPLIQRDDEPDELLLLRPAAGLGGSPDVVTGWLRIPYVTHPFGIDSIALWIRPPSPFESQDIPHMWSELLAADLGVPRSVPAQGSLITDAQLRHVTEGINFPALKYYWEVTRTLLSNWPQRETASRIWKPIDVAGGREDERLTLRHPRAGAGIASRGLLIPEKSARVVGRTDDWTIDSVARVSHALADRLESAVDASSLPVIRNMIIAARQIAGRSRARGGSSDPPMSSWPELLATYFRAALLALAEASTVGQTKDLVPLCNLWNLYEAWVAISAFTHSRQILGEPHDLEVSTAPYSTMWLARWSLPSGGILELSSQATIGGSLSWEPQVLSSDLISISSYLIPDLLLAYQEPESDLTALAIDAKKRSGDRFTRGSIAEAGSKYLWGIRRRETPEAPGSGLASVVLVSPVPADDMLDPPNARIQTALWHPRIEEELPVRTWLRSLGVPEATGNA